MKEFRFKAVELKEEDAKGHQFLPEFGKEYGRRIFGKRTLQDVQNKTYEKLYRQLNKDGFKLSHTDENGYQVYTKVEKGVLALAS